MYVFIAHAEADQAAADELKAFLKSRGLIAETETGARGYRHLQQSDVVIGAWSQKAVFDTHRMAMEARMLDAWSGGRLVLVKLDHGILPVGLRDLPAIDTSIETNRDLAVWPQVERAARDAMNRALVEQQASEDKAASIGSAEPQPARKRKPADTLERSRGDNDPVFTGFGKMLLLAAATICIGAAILNLTIDLDHSYLSRIASWGIVWAGGLFLLLVVIPGTIAGRLAKRHEQPAPAVSAPEPNESVFISYSHADASAVEPVVAIVEKTGRDVWIDKQDVTTGDGWAGEIVRGIKAARRVMVMCSPHAFESDHIKREVYLADRYKKPMLPVFIADAKPPEDFEYFFAGVQWLELFRLPEADRAAAIDKALAAG